MRKGGRFIFSSSIIRDIFGVARSEKPLIDHSSRGKSYRNLYVHSAARFANWHLPSLMHMHAFRFLLLHSHRGTVTIDIRERRKCLTFLEANDYFVPFHTHTFYAYFHTFIVSHLIQFAFFLLYSAVDVNLILPDYHKLLRMPLLHKYRQSF